MKIHHVIGILAVIIIVGGLYLLFSADTTPRPDTGESVVNGTEQPQDDQDEVPEGWEQYQNPQFDFTFQYPQEGTATIEVGQVKVTYLGPDNTPASEITDGFTFYVSTLDGTGRTLSEVAADQFEEDSATLEVIVEPATATRFEREAYSYQLETMLGPAVTHVVLGADGDQFFTVSYMISGDDDGTYAEYVDTMIGTLSMGGDTAGSNDEESTETVSIALLDSEFEGEPERGCDQVVMVDREVPATTMPLTEALNELFGLDTTDVAGSYNFIANTNDTLIFNRATISDGVASIYLTGELSGLAGVCDNPRARIQIEETALQFDTVDEVELFLNGRSTDLQPSQQ